MDVIDVTLLAIMGASTLVLVWALWQWKQK